ncbi:MAG: hypothetical protein HY265_06335 [Deltaproteobacteria bacterium]|nr:hypothetical protein [Deltaproteobacteria bacterium]
MRTIKRRKADMDGLVRIEGIIFQIPHEFAGQVIGVDADAKEFYPHLPAHGSDYPVLKIAGAGRPA